MRDENSRLLKNCSDLENLQTKQLEEISQHKEAFVKETEKLHSENEKLSKQYSDSLEAYNVLEKIYNDLKNPQIRQLEEINQHKEV